LANNITSKRIASNKYTFNADLGKGILPCPDIKNSKLSGLGEKGYGGEYPLGK